MKILYRLLPAWFFTLACNAIVDPQANQQGIRLKAAAAMEQKVNKVIIQLRSDCDSSLLSLAKMQADSIRKATPRRKPTRKQTK